MVGDVPLYLLAEFHVDSGAYDYMMTSGTIMNSSTVAASKSLVETVTVVAHYYVPPRDSYKCTS